ncbi:MAG: 50S ribosomal protein L28 [bacterium]|nr:50S ribosomal protein L28 [bacterium]
MARQCAICGKKPVAGRSIVRRGIPKKKGGIGLHTTGITPRRFIPNLQHVRVKLPSGQITHLRVCTRCLKAGKVMKA